ncbi:iron transporter [Halomicrobium urmianum]|uniref:iron transporter n=1 Tax=Halomicrobium urmianum TaxID=1586233 RepID=UPI001CD96EE6|nr:iron transporter [Halomicrobium urmianum]
MSTDPLQPSEEADERQLELAREAGDAFTAAVEYMIEEVAHTGDTREVGDCLVGFAQEEAEGMYHVEDGELNWREPGDDENCHVEVVVASSADGRFLPGMNPQVTFEGDEETVGPVDVPLVWHPGLYHYGVNVSLPGDGTYDLHVEADAPGFPRHDEENGDRFTEPIDETFEDVDVETGQD